MATPRLKPADSTILDWVKSYSKLVEKFERRMKPKIKGRIHVDDVVLKEERKTVTRFKLSTARQSIT